MICEITGWHSPFKHNAEGASKAEGAPDAPARTGAHNTIKATGLEPSIAKRIDFFIRFVLGLSHSRLDHPKSLSFSEA